MRMTLSQKQRHFSRMMHKLEAWVFSQPAYELTDGEAWRPPEMAEIYAKDGRGILNSKHCIRLARDLNLFIVGVYQSKSEAYKPMGEYWKSLDAMNRWGGDFKDGKGNPRPDGNHFQYDG